MMTVDDLVVPATWLRPAPGQLQQMRAAHEDIQPVIEQAHAQPVADQTGGRGMEHLAQGESAGAGYGDDDLLEVRGPACGQSLQMRALGSNPLSMRRVASADNPVDQGATGVEIIKVRTATHQKRIPDRTPEVSVGTFDRAVLMRHPFVVAGRCHQVVGAQRVMARREICPRVSIEIAECR